MRNLYIILVLIVTTPITAQNAIESIQKEINHTVWKPFQKAFETLNGSAVNELYAEEVIRVTPQGIDTKNDFIKLDFWFDSRKTTTNTSYEVGFYRMKITLKGQLPKYSYGQFHIVLKKIEGKWKITQDWDTETIGGEKITAKDFDKKKPLHFKF